VVLGGNEFVVGIDPGSAGRIPSCDPILIRWSTGAAVRSQLNRRRVGVHVSMNHYADCVEQHSQHARADVENHFGIDDHGRVADTSGCALDVRAGNRRAASHVRAAAIRNLI